MVHHCENTLLTLIFKSIPLESVLTSNEIFIKITRKCLNQIQVQGETVNKLRPSAQILIILSHRTPVSEV